MIGKGLAHIFKLDFNRYVNSSTLDDKFLILSSGQHWELPSPTKITKGCYRCYNLHLVNLYNHTSLTFACNVCNFHSKSIVRLPEYKDKASVYRTRQYAFYHHLDFDSFWIHNLNSVDPISVKSVYQYFINNLFLKIEFYFANDEESGKYNWTYNFYRQFVFHSWLFMEDVNSLKDINHIKYPVQSKKFIAEHTKTYWDCDAHHCWKVKDTWYDHLCFEVFFQPYFVLNEKCLVFSFAGRGYTDVYDFPDGTGEYWGFDFITKVQDYHVEYNHYLFNY